MSAVTRAHILGSEFDT